MLYTFFGTDIEKIRTRSRNLVDVLREKRSDASYFRLHQENWSINQFTELTRSQGLFSAKYIVLLDNLLTGDPSQKEVKDLALADEVILESLELIKKSDHIWIIVEDAMLGKSSGKELGVRDSKELSEIEELLKKYSDKIETYSNKDGAGILGSSRAVSATRVSRSGGQSEVTSFTFTDALFDKQTVNAINALTVLDLSGASPEEIHGALWWQTKSLVQIAAKSTASLSPYVVQKGNRFLKNWTQEELHTFTNEVVDMYHLAHLGKKDLKDELMRLALKFGK